MRSRFVSALRKQPVAVVALILALGGGSYATASTVVHSSATTKNTIYGCVGDNTGRLRVVDSPIRCGSLETSISFNREGHRGATGKTGAKGKTGVNGKTGTQGAAGKDGTQGKDGADSNVAGPQGDTGDTGDTGPAGNDGRNALTATAAELAGTNCPNGGVKVSAGIDSNANETLDDDEVNSDSVRYVCDGAKGDQGETGPTGATGTTGATGAQGALGPVGPVGPIGAKGDIGATGAKGDIGATGAKGDTGAIGATGAKGDTGAAGADGPTETASSLLNKLTTVDGDGSTLDADRLDGYTAGNFVLSSQFGGLFDTRFDQLFGSADQSTEINTSGGLDQFMASVYLTAATFPPPGTAFASGQIMMIQSNSALFALLGTQYGGDGNTTFALPDLRKQAPGGLHYVITLQGVFPSRS
jgi:hypothetical protein